MDELRIGDAEREQALGVLGEQYALGRISKDELDERSDAVWSARTRGDLRPVFADLPVRTPGARGERPRPSRPARPRLPLVPVLVLLGVLTVLTHLPWVLLGLVVWFVVLRPHRRQWHGRGASWGRGRTAQISGNRFDARGSWS